jgi:hypothetical protein
MDDARREWLLRLIAACRRAAAALDGTDHPHQEMLLGDIRALERRLAAELAAAPAA